MRRQFRAGALAAACALVASSCVFLQRVSVNSVEQQTTAASRVNDVSEDGRYVVFESDGALVGGDNNGVTDVYVRDTFLGSTERVSVGDVGQEGDDESRGGSISDDGRFVAFQSRANNLGPVTITGTAWNVFLHDRQVGSTMAVTSKATTNSENPAMSGDGTYVAFEIDGPLFSAAQDQNGATDIFTWNRVTGLFQYRSKNTAGAQGDGDSIQPAINRNGTAVAFASASTNLATGDNNQAYDIFVNFLSGSTQRVSVDEFGGEANDDSFSPMLDDVGFNVGFYSQADNLVSGDINSASDVFVKSLLGAIELVSVRDDGTQYFSLLGPSPGGLSGDGNRVVFSSGEGTSVRVYKIRDRDAGTTTSFGEGANQTGMALSRDGRYVAYTTEFADVADDTNVIQDVYIQSFPDPQPTTVSPPTVERGQTTAITVSGRGFTDVTKIWTEFFVTPDNKISYSNLVVVDDSTITADVTVTSDAALGPFWVNLESPSGGPGSGSGAFGNCKCLEAVD